MEGHVISKCAQKVSSKLEANMTKMMNETDDVTTLLEYKPSCYLVYDASLGKNAIVPAIGTPSILFIFKTQELCSIL